jgi:hypothetical protein
VSRRQNSNFISIDLFQKLNPFLKINVGKRWILHLQA